MNSFFKTIVIALLFAACQEQATTASSTDSNTGGVISQPTNGQTISSDQNMGASTMPQAPNTTAPTDPSTPQANVQNTPINAGQNQPHVAPNPAQPQTQTPAPPQKLSEAEAKIANQALAKGVAEENKMTVKKGETFTVSLPIVTGTIYDWGLVERPDSKYLEFVSRNKSTAKDKTVSNILIKAKEAGKTTIQFQLVKLGDKKGMNESLKTFEITIKD